MKKKKNIVKCAVEHQRERGEPFSMVMDQIFVSLLSGPCTIMIFQCNQSTDGHAEVFL